MRFGIREICDVVLRAKATQTLGSRKFYKNEPVLYFDTLKTSSLEGAATTVYAQGGRGNTRLVAWEGERTLTFTMEDALLSMESFSILSGAGLMEASGEKPIYVHQTSQVLVEKDNTIVLPDLACWNGLEKGNERYHSGADIFIMVLENGEVNAEPCIPAANGVAYDDDAKTTTITCYSHDGKLEKDTVVLVDYYVKRTGGAQMIEITADKFGGNYYLEASTLFRRESDGVDMPAEFIIPNCKVQSNFTFSLAATGDPSTFTFTMDAFPDYTKFDPTHKVLAAIQVITDEDEDEDKGPREACLPFDVAGYGDAKLSITHKESGNNVAVTVVGQLDEGDDLYDADEFGSLSGNAFEIDFTLPVEKDKTYTIVQTNPALAQFYPSDFAGGVKTKTYSGSVLAAEPYQVILGEGKTPVTIKLSDNTGNVIQNITIDNKVTFA